MPSPNPGDVHINTALTNLSIAYKQDADAYIAEKVFPFVGVSKQSDSYYKYEKGCFFRDAAKLRAPATESAGGGFDLADDSYRCKKWSFHKDNDEDTEANADEVLNMEEDAADFVMETLLIRRERLFIQTYFGSGIWGTDETGTTNFVKWDDYATSDPGEDIKRGRMGILISTGRLPNRLVVGYKVHEALKTHPLIKTYFFGNNAQGTITKQMLATYFEVAEYCVSYALFTQDDASVADPTLELIAGNHALLVYAAPKPSKMLPSGGYIFGWKGLTGLNNIGVRTKKFYMDKEDATRIETDMCFDMKLVAADMGHMFLDAVD